MLLTFIDLPRLYYEGLAGLHLVKLEIQQVPASCRETTVELKMK